MPAIMSLSFLEASQQKKKGNITEGQYLDYLLAHVQGTEHEEDDKDACDDLTWERRKSVEAY
jgi:hypothetical protein